MHAVCSTSLVPHLPPLHPVLNMIGRHENYSDTTTLGLCIHLIAVSLLGVNHVLMVGWFLEAAAASAIHGQCPAPLIQPLAPHDPTGLS